MKSIKLVSTTDADGNLRVPLNLPNCRVEVVVAWEETQPANETDPSRQVTQTASAGGGWPPGFFDRFAGAFADDPIERGAQGIAEEREQLG